MGRELRMIKPGWQHPSDGFYHDGSVRYKGLFGRSYTKSLADWEEGLAKWQEGLVEDWSPALHDSPNKLWKPIPQKYVDEGMTWEQYYGERPVPEDYMPEWAPGEATLFVMYEDTSEGTPISPAFATIEELARWLADNNASRFGDMTASYDVWLDICKEGFEIGCLVQATALHNTSSLLVSQVC